MEKEPLGFTVRLDEKALMRFQLYSVYHNLQGYVALFISFLCILYVILRWDNMNVGMRILFIVLGVFYLLVKPVELLFKTKLLSKQDAFKLPLTFTCDDEKITVLQGDQTAEFTWDKIWRIVSRKKDIYIYTGRLYAYILPKEEIKDAVETFLRLAADKGCRLV